jgi:putative flippase GtrA
MIGQIILAVTLFQKKPSKILTYISIGGLGLLLLFMFLIGLISLNYKIALSTIPFIVVAVLTVIHYRKPKVD